MGGTAWWCRQAESYHDFAAALLPRGLVLAMAAGRWKQTSPAVDIYWRYFRVTVYPADHPCGICGIVRTILPIP